MSPALEVRDLHVRIGSARIVDGVSWSVEPGQTLGIVGESGSGKSMSVLAATGLIGPPTAQGSGQVLLAADGALAHWAALYGAIVPLLPAE